MATHRLARETPYGRGGTSAPDTPSSRDSRRHLPGQPLDSRVPATPTEQVDFAALDVETANPDPASICQVGIATVRAGRVARVWTQFVRPPGRFSRHHIRIHGITSEAVANAPPFAQLHSELERRLPEFVVTHTGFDVAALLQACRRDRLPMFRRAWLDSSRIPNLVWPGRFPHGSRGLAPITGRLGIRFRHHDAGEDARAAAEIVLHCLNASRTAIRDWAGAGGSQAVNGIRKVDRNGI